MRPAVEALEDRQLLSGLGGLLASNIGLFNPDLTQPVAVAPQVQTPAPIAVTSTTATAQTPVAVTPTAPAAPATPSNPVSSSNTTTIPAPTVTSQATGTNQTAIVAPASQTVQADFGSATTDWTRTQSVNQFNPSLGTLTAVEVTNSGTLTSHIKVESLDGASAAVTGTVSGNLTLTGAGFPSLVTSTNAATENFQAGAFDGTIDFAGTSGKDFGNKSSGGSKSTVLTSPTDLANFIGLGKVSFTDTAHATSSADGAGNLLSQINSTAQAIVTVKYDYIPAPPAPPPVTVAVNPLTPPLTKRMFLASTFRQFA
ncbi:MAG TPA: choice-of-anchor E domain-containing protein [Gemmataceae bacterium]